MNLGLIKAAETESELRGIGHEIGICGAHHGPKKSHSSMVLPCGRCHSRWGIHREAKIIAQFSGIWAEDWAC